MQRKPTNKKPIPLDIISSPTNLQSRHKLTYQLKLPKKGAPKAHVPMCPHPPNSLVAPSSVGETPKAATCSERRGVQGARTAYDAVWRRVGWGGEAVSYTHLRAHETDS